MTIKHEPRYIPGIFIDRCKHVTLENIHINHAGSMGVIAQFTENITINQLQICVDEASGNMVSANADALHFVGCSGKLLIENSRFEQQLDDILNVHGNYLKVHKIMDSTHVIAEIPHRQQLGAFGIKRGAELRICDDKTMRCKGVTYLEGYRTINNKYYLLEFSAPFLFEQGTGYCVEDGDAYPSVIFRNCTGGRNRARGLLLASAKDILIEGNQLDCEGAAVKICTDMDFWYESGRTTKVTICNNRIKRHNTGVWGKAIFDIDPQAKEFEPDFYINGEIIIRENIIESGEEPLIAVKSTAMLRVEDNIIISDTIRSDQELRINAQHMGVIQINNNSYKDKQRKEETYGQA